MINLPPTIALAQFGDAFSMSARPTPVSSDGTHRFQHFAMACPWSLWIAEVEFDYAAQLAQDVWDEVDRLEGELSRFIVSSDIYRLNAALRQGDSGWVNIGVTAWECLYLGLTVSELTGGAFDIALGDTIEARRGEDDLIREVTDSPQWEGAWNRYLQLAEEPLRARLTDTRAQVDLGALGKGYALDISANLLRDWGIQHALFSAGQSTILGLGDAPDTANQGAKGWPVALRPPSTAGSDGESGGRGILQNMALSGSAQVLHGSHIIDGRTGKTASNWRGAWAVAPTAALSDACSTAFMVMDFAEIQAFCSQQIKVGALLLDNDGQWQRCGIDVWELDSPNKN
ncbi:FAD:protein FMN transferase [bacterium]|nr:MAG: FAD:protein FMN transferase [bacterium]